MAAEQHTFRLLQLRHLAPLQAQDSARVARLQQYQRSVAEVQRQQGEMLMVMSMISIMDHQGECDSRPCLVVLPFQSISTKSWTEALLNHQVCLLLASQR